MKALWERLWFAPETAVNLAAARIVFAAHAIWILLSRDYPSISSLPAAFWTLSPASDRLRFLFFPGHESLERAIQFVTIAALVAAMLGIRARLACLVSGVLLYHLAPLETIFWTPSPYERGLTTDVLALLTLSVTRCGDALALSKSQERGDPSDYGWGLRLTQFHLATIYLQAGLSKLHRGGLGWVDGENIRRWLLVFEQEEQVRAVSPIGPWMADRIAVAWGVGIGALLIDLAFVLAVFWRRGRPWIVAAAAIGHVGILLAFRIAFLNLPQLLIFVDWSALGRRWRRWKERYAGSGPVPSEP